MTGGAYPGYKASGADWFDQVPDHWAVDKYGRAFEVTLGKMIQPGMSGPEDSHVCYLNAASVQPGGLAPSPEKLMWASEAEVRKFAVHRGDLLVTEGGDVGRSAFYRDLEPVIFQNSLHRVRAIRGNDLRLAKYALDAVRSSGYLDEITNKATIRHLTREKLANLKFATPPQSEQRQIADYLDAHTAKIDTLIEKQERLIETLAERRQAVISHAVTKGLDPNAPIRESGVEWLPAIPATWSAAPLKSVAAVVGRIGFRGYTTEDIVAPGEGAITLSPSNLVDSRLALDESTYISWEKYEESPEIIVSPGEIVVVKTGSSMGKIAVADHASEIAVTINPQLAIIKPHSCSAAYLLYSLSTARVMAEFRSRNAGGSIPTMTQRTIGNVDISLPPMAVQSAIVEYLDHETTKIDALSAKAREMIDILKERRQSLISAAVTGKIDVRGLS